MSSSHVASPEPASPPPAEACADRAVPRVETARRWEELVSSYSAPGSDALLNRVPDRVERPLDVAGRREAHRIDALRRRQVSVAGGVGAASLATTAGAAALDSVPLALTAALTAATAAVVAVVRRWRLTGRRAALMAGDAHDTWQMTRFGRWLVARAHEATVRAGEAEGGPPDTAVRMAESLHRFTDDVRRLERIVAASSAVADTYGRLRRVDGHLDQVDTLLEAQAHTLRALDLFESTAREVVLAAHAERAAGERACVVASLLDLQAEALTRRQALAALDDPH